MKVFHHSQARTPSLTHVLAFGLLLTLCLFPALATSAASRAHRGGAHTHHPLAGRLLATPVDVRDARAYQMAISTAGRSDSTPTTGPAQADQVELIVFHFFPSGETEWSWTDPATGSRRVDSFAGDGAHVQSTIIIGNQAEFIGYPQKEESFSPIPTPIQARSSIGLMQSGTRQQLRSASTVWKETGTAVINGHNVHIYEQDGLVRFDDGGTGPSANVASIDPTSMLVYRQVLLDLRHGQRSIVSGYDYDYRVIPRSSTASARIFQFVALAGFSSPPLPAQHK